MPNETPDLNIAHIRDNDNVFQVLNTDGTDWDEEATRTEYVAWMAPR